LINKIDSFFVFLLLQKMIPVRLDCKNIRSERQRINDESVFQAIKNSQKSEVLSKINGLELNRVLHSTGLSIDALIEACSKNDIMNRILSGRISKNASRQGAKDETTQIQVCSVVAAPFGIQIENISPIAFRPKKTGEIVSADTMKSANISKDECLKSFDGRISGKLSGWIFAKVVFGAGGHQDNVFEEADCLCHWVSQYHSENPDLFVLLIDTDLYDKFETLQKKYAHIPNILITNHYDFQNYLINTYSNKCEQI